MEFIKDINKYSYGYSNLIDNIKVFIKLNNGIDNSISKYWYKNGLIHRENDKPAFEYFDGGKFWYINGKRHRENDKPSVEFPWGGKIWYVNDKFIKRNYNYNNIVYNDKFFNGNVNEIH